MRILILGAGAIGGYYGGRLAAAGADATFLVRPRRAEQIARDGLVIKSPKADVRMQVKTVSREEARPGYDAILLSCKAYDLDDAIDSVRPAAAGALIIPLLNGMRHLDTLDAAFGQDHVAGGVALIGTTMEADGSIVHLDRGDGLSYGERTPAQAGICAALAPVMTDSGFAGRHSTEIIQEMWEKFAFITSTAGICCLMRGDIGAIARTQEGVGLVRELIAECVAAISAAGFPPRAPTRERLDTQLTNPASTMTASMLRDLWRGNQVEAQHVVGDMLARAQRAGLAAPLLRAVYTSLQVYQAGL